MANRAANFFAALERAGMPRVPDEFSVVPHYQVIPQCILAEIDAFIAVFERVTRSLIWQAAVTADAPPIARLARPEVCFFSAWDFHLPAGAPEQWQLIEFNDNGSGFLVAALINRLFYEQYGLQQEANLVAPPPFAVLSDHLLALIAREAEDFFGHCPAGLWLILDAAEVLQAGRFRWELMRLRDLLRQQGWDAEIGAPEALVWDANRLCWQGRPVVFIVNRATDFIWQGDEFAALRTAYRAGHTYIAPNPFTYATRSDKRLLALLSSPERDAELGIREDERALLSAHVPETHIVNTDTIEMLARRKEEFVFKPMHGFAARGLLASAQVGRSRLRRLLQQGAAYVAQKKVPKPWLVTDKQCDERVWTDLRVWAYRGQRYLLSGRASRQPERMDLQPPGGWLPSYVAR